jgi:hypothetical protein
LFLDVILVLEISAGSRGFFHVMRINFCLGRSDISNELPDPNILAQGGQAGPALIDFLVDKRDIVPNSFNSEVKVADFRLILLDILCAFF